MPQAGQILHQRYQLITLLGNKAKQQTWLAIDQSQQPQEQVVMKLLAMNPQMAWEEARLLEREAQTLQKLNHPRIPQYRDYFLLDHLLDSRFPWFCLVQSQVPGHSLQHLLHSGYRFSEAALERIAIEVLSILIYLHELSPPLLHRDIKPSNLIWGKDKRLYLIDFGAVQDRAAMDGASFTVVGTYGYVPSEQFSGQSVPASDLYAVGATLIHLMTGVAPAELPQQNGRVQFADRVGVDPAFVNWVTRLVEPDLADRLKTARVALVALEQRQQLSLPLVRRRPTGSRIQIKKSIGNLDIHIPARGWRALSWLNVISTLLSMLDIVGWPLLLVFPLAIYYLPEFSYLAFLTLLAGQVGVVLVFLSAGFVLPTLRETVIRANRTHFTLDWKLFGLTVRRQRGRIARIDPDTSIYDQEKRGSKGIVVEAGGAWLCTNPIAGIERQWLIQELRDWLNALYSKETPNECNARFLQSSRVEIKECEDEIVIQYPGKEYSTEYGVIVMVPIMGLLFLRLIQLLPQGPLIISASYVIVAAFSLIVIGARKGWNRFYVKCFPTKLRLDHNHFVLSKCLLGFTRIIAECSIERIQKIEPTTSGFIMRTPSGAHQLGQGLNKLESQLVAEAINQWLQQTRHEK